MCWKISSDRTANKSRPTFAIARHCKSSICTDGNSAAVAEKSDDFLPQLSAIGDTMTVIVDGRIWLAVDAPKLVMASSVRLLQLRVLGSGRNQDGDIRVGVFPEREEIVISSPGFRGVAL